MDRQPIQRRFISPLWIISIFFSFSESVLGYAVLKTTSATHVALICLVIAFPLMVAGCFLRHSRVSPGPPVLA
jgi:hypothetical protein